MKCPKCGFNSFEYFDSCKRCSADLIGFKQTYSISSLILPQEAKAPLAAQLWPSESSTDEVQAAPEVHGDIFSFDLPNDSAPSSAEDPFSFDQSAPEASFASEVTSDDSIFSNLLESTPLPESPSFAPQASVDTKPAAPASSMPGEFDFDGFSWDEAPEATATAGDTDATDEFGSFFEDTKESSSK